MHKFIRYTASMATDLKYNLHLFNIPNPAKYMLSSGTVSGTSHPLGYNLDVTGLEKDKQETVKSIIDRGDKSFGEYINDTAVDIQADLIVLLKENRSFLEKIFKASSTAKIIKKARLPLLVFHENE